MFLRNVFAVLLTVFSVGVLAQEKSITFSGLVKNPDGSVPADEVTTVEVAVLSSKDVPTDNVCVLRHEKFTGVQVRDGSFTVQIGTGDTAFSGHLNPSSVLPLSSVLSGVAKTGLNCFDADENPVTAGYTPGAGHGRKVRAIVNLGGQAVTADFSMNANAFAFHADNANKADKLPGLASASCSTGQYVKSISETGVLTCETPSAGAESDPTVQAFAKTSVGNGIRVHPTTDALEADIGTSAGQIVALDGSNKLPAVDGSQLINLPSVSSFTGSLNGDVTGNQGATRVEAIRNQPITADGSSTGQVLRYAGSGSWTPGFVGMLDLRSNATGAQSLSSNCNESQTFTYNSVSDSLSCQNISISSSQISDWATATQNFLDVNQSTVNFPAGVDVIKSLNANTVLGSSTSPFEKIFVGSLAKQSGVNLDMSTGVFMFGAQEKINLGTAGEIDIKSMKLTNVANGTLGSDAVNKSQMDSAIAAGLAGANYLLKDGSVRMTGDFLPDSSGTRSLGEDNYAFGQVASYNFYMVNGGGRTGEISSTPSEVSFSSTANLTLSGATQLSLDSSGGPITASAPSLTFTAGGGDATFESTAGATTISAVTAAQLLGDSVLVKAITQNVVIEASQGYATLYAPLGGANVFGHSAKLESTNGDTLIKSVTTGKISLVGNIKQSTQSGSTSAIDFGTGNIVTTTFNCSSNIVLTNLLKGGTYTLIVTDTGTNQCSFDSAVSGQDSASVTYKFSPANGVREASKHTIYTLMRVGDIVYVSWIAGFN